MPSLVSDLTSSAMTLSRAVSIAAKTSSMDAVLLTMRIRSYPSQPPVNPALDLGFEAAAGTSWGWDGRRLPDRKDPERRFARPLARRQDDAGRGDAVRLRPRPAPGLDRSADRAHGLRARRTEAQDPAQPRRRLRHARR